MSSAHSDALELPRPVLSPGWASAYTTPPVPFAEGGRDPSGWDCWGLLRFVYAQEFGLALPSYADDYESTGDADRIGELAADEIRDWLEIDRPEPGDAVWCAIAGMPCHVGIYVERGRMLHALKGVGTRVERIRTPAWARRIKAYYRHPDWRRSTR